MLFVQILVHGLTLGILAFAAGFLLGAFRVLVAIPAVSKHFSISTALATRYAELVEMPIMMTVAFLETRMLNRKFPGTANSRVLVGFAGVFTLLFAEIIFSKASDPSKSVYDMFIGAKDPISGPAFLLSMVLFAALPKLATVSKGKQE